MSRTAKRRISIFWVCLLAFVILALAAMAWGLVKLEPILAAYEASQPKYFAEAIFNEHFSTPNYADLVARAGLPDNLSPFETEDGFVAELDERYDGQPMSYAATTAGSDGSLRYLVKAGDAKLATFSMVKAAEKTTVSGLEFDIWQLGEIVLYIRPEESVTVIAQKGSTVYLNGKPLDDSYLVEDGIETDSCAHMPEGVEGITFRTYSATALLREPAIEVKTADGVNAPLHRDSETGAWTADVVYDDTLAAAHSEKIISVAQNYAAFVMKDARFASFSKYFDSTTDLYKTISQVPTAFVWAHNGFAFRDVSATEFYGYSPDVFSCRVRFVHVLHRNNREDYTEQFDVTFYLHRVNGEFLIYDMVNN